jgi:sugar O-acyltransferase (sialic acid O-acetyltransferase NeuD family)
MKPIAIYGAGGFGKEVATVIQKINEKTLTWDLVGFFDDGLPQGTAVSKYGIVLGGKKELNDWTSPLSVVFAIGHPVTLKKVYEGIQNPQVDYPNLIHPEVYFADEETLSIGQGNVIVRGCSFSVDVTIGDFNQMNSLSALAHDVSIGSFNVFMPLSRISGSVSIGDLNFFGINAIVLQNIKIGANTRIGANSVVMRQTKDHFLYLGNPARKMKL